MGYRFAMPAQLANWELPRVPLGDALDRRENTMLVSRVRNPMRRTRGREIAFVVLATVFIALLFATPALAVEYEYVGKFGSYGSGDGQFHLPVDVGVSASSGDVYVLDAFSDRVQVFDSSRQFKFGFASSGFDPGQIFNPQGLAIGPNGDVYIGDYGNNRVSVFDSAGTFKTTWGSFGTGDGQFNNAPFGLAVAADGTVYAADSYNHRIQAFNSAGDFQTKWGSFGTADGQFQYPMGVAVSPTTGDIYVAEWQGHRVQVFDSSGTFKFKWGSSGMGDGQFSDMRGIAISASGDVYVGDGSRVQVFDGSGQFKGKFGSWGSGDGQFDGVIGLAVAPTGDIYVVDAWHYRVQIFRPVASNHAPEITSVQFPSAPVPVNTEVTGVVNFTDSDSGDAWASEFTWGDGAITNGTMDVSASPKSGTATHSYTTPGVYQLGVEVSDGIDEDYEAVPLYLVVYDPNGSFVTGGGSIDSPIGAYRPDPTLAGKATFGFVSKYTRGAASGNTEFQFHAAGMTFKSTSYDWLIVAGARAQYKGSGTLDDGTQCGFMLTAVDGQVTGGGGFDKFRIKIWNRETDTVIYDNQLDTADGAELGSSTATTGGSIVVHKRS